MRTRIAVLLLLAPLTIAAACTSEEGTTPECTPNVTDDGVSNVEDGCQQFPACDGDATAVKCCGENTAMSIDCGVVSCRLGFGIPKSAFTAAERDVCLSETGAGGSGTGAGGSGGSGISDGGGGTGGGTGGTGG